MPLIDRELFLQTAIDASPHPDAPDAEVLTRLLSDRFSCRGYKPDQLPRALIRRMLAIAQLSASWCNSQPWHTIVTEGAGTERFAATLFEHARADHAAHHGAPPAQPDLPFPKAYPGVYKARQREVGWQLYESVGIAHGDRVASGRQALENFRMFGAPHALVVTSERDLGTYGAIDTGLYLGSMLLAAQSLGIGMVPQAALAGYAPFIRAYFDIPDNRVVVFGASFGLADGAHPANAFRSRRSPLDEAVRWVSR